MTSGWQPAGDRELRVGLAGLGSMGRNHLRVLHARPDVRLAAVADPVDAALSAAADQVGAQGFDEPLAMIAEADLDAVVIAAPTTAHVPLALAAIDRGIAVLVEKPLAATTDEAIRIVAAARASGVPVQVGHVERFNPAVLELGRLIGEGWLSTVYSIASRRAGPFPARIRDVGVTVDLATHDVDILSWIAGERPLRVYAETAQRIHATNEDLLFGLLHFPSGATGMLDVNWLTPAKRRQLVVVGEEGMFELDYLTQRLTFTQATDTTNPRLIGGYAPTFEGEVHEVPVASSEPLASEIDAFLGVVRQGGRPVVDAEDGLWAVAVATSLLAAAADGRVIDLSALSSRFAPA
ncbi:MAG TPA: Gfo/Idh/MocA family oxidoreductase [Candidatus Limnocylindrales bacterium]|nr:Gfo/Idh/MocA family oxidoreductase [Candidatus Limnocylindrales bacterium]